MNYQEEQEYRERVSPEMEYIQYLIENPERPDEKEKDISSIVTE